MNKLQYFEPLKPETDSETKQDPVNNTVDLTRVHFLPSISTYLGRH